MKLLLVLVNIAFIFMSALSLYESFSIESSIHAEMNRNLGYQAILYFCAFLVGTLTQLTSNLKVLGLVTSIVGILGAAYITYDKLA